MPGTESGRGTARNPPSRLPPTGHAAEPAERARPEVARGLDLAGVDAVDGHEQRQDEVRQGAVDEREDDRRRLAVQPAARLGEQADAEEELLDAEGVQHAGAEAV